jgi:hypothetical protein
MTDSQHQVDSVSEDLTPTQDKMRSAEEAGGLWNLKVTHYMDTSPELLVGDMRETYRLLTTEMSSRLPKDWIRLCVMRVDSDDDIRI